MESAAPLPGGTVTFLFTDIEGSTRLWEQHPDAMRRALARHHTLVAAEIEERGGVVVKSQGEGDSVFAVFARATDAVTAACALQHAFATEPWLTPSPLRVRIALHTGEAELRAGDYYGTAVNRCARLRSIAHGGQVLLSLATEELVREALPAGASLRDLGLIRLQDLAHPEHVFQLAHPDLPGEFPPLRSLDALPNNLPVQLTSFIGREEAMTEVKRLLTTTHLLTLTGSGGCGKTRLALQVAADLLGEYPDGVWLVELAPLAEPALVPQTVASTLGVREEPGRPLTATLADTLRSKQLLLLLDNCEHMLAGCAQLAETLLRACPMLRVLASSREALNIAGETAYRVPSLSLPDAQRLPAGEQLMQFEAVRLLVDRAAAAAPSFRLSPSNTAAVAQVCHRLDGIPLAIELAAARVRVLSIEQIAERLDDRFRLLTGGSRTALPRQQTLRALIDWSYDLLSEAERALLRRLSVFAGGWTLPAAEAVCAWGASVECEVFSIKKDAVGPESLTLNTQHSTLPLAEGEVLDLLTGLVDKSLVVVEAQGAVTRYRLLETVRQYARDRLWESGEGAATRTRHLEYFLRLVEEAGTQWAEQPEGLARLERELDNLRAAVEWSGALDDGAEKGLRLVVAPGMFWRHRGYYAEGREIVAGALERATGAPPALRAWALAIVGDLASWQGEPAAARPLLQESLAIYRTLEDPESVAGTLWGMALAAEQQGDLTTYRLLMRESIAIRRTLLDQRGALERRKYAELLCQMGWYALAEDDLPSARSHFTEALQISREVGDRLAVAFNCAGLGRTANAVGEHEEARKLLEESLAIGRELGSQWLVAFALWLLGRAAYGQQRHELASSHFEESLGAARTLGSRRLIAASLVNLGYIALDQGDPAAARSLGREGLEAAASQSPAIVIGLELMACIAVAEGEPVAAARLLGAVEAAGEQPERDRTPREREIRDRALAAARAAAGDEAFAVAWAEGRAMALEVAIENALED